MTKAINECTSLQLKESKECADRVLEGQAVALEIESRDHAVRLVEELIELGANAMIDD